MAQSGYTPIQLYYSTTAAAVPVNTNLASGELALNIQDEKLYFKNAAGTVKLLASNATSAPVTSFSAGTTGLTPSTATTGAVTLAGTLATTNGGTGLTSFTSGGVVYASSTSALATGSALTFDGTNLGVSASAPVLNFTFSTNTNFKHSIVGTNYSSTASDNALDIKVASGSGTQITAATFNGAGNLGLGVTPSAWGSGTSVIDLATGGSAGAVSSSGTLSIANNGFFNGTNWIYKNTNTALTYQQILGEHRWNIAPSGTAGNTISFTQAMTLNASGNLGVGTTSPLGRLDSSYNITSYEGGQFVASNVAKTNYASITAVNGQTFTTIQTYNSSVAAGALILQPSAGNVGIGTTSPSDKLTVVGSINLPTVNSYIRGGGHDVIQVDATRTYFYGGTSGIQMRSSNNALALFEMSDAGVFTFSPSGTERARIQTGFSVGTTADPGAGAIYATGNITAYYSDARLKTVSGKIENALDKVAQLSGVYYTNNDVAKSFGYENDEEQVGVLAQDVEAVLPQIVKAAPFDLDENGNSKSGENYKTVQYERLVPLLIEAINELQAKVKALEAK